MYNVSLLLKLHMGYYAFNTRPNTSASLVIFTNREPRVQWAYEGNPRTLPYSEDKSARAMYPLGPWTTLVEAAVGWRVGRLLLEGVRHIVVRANECWYSTRRCVAHGIRVISSEVQRQRRAELYRTKKIGRSRDFPNSRTRARMSLAGLGI